MSTDRPAETAALQAFNRDLMGKLRGYQLNLQIADQLAEAAARERDRAVGEAGERVAAMQTVIGALLDSLRPYGLDRRRFSAAIRAAAARTPGEGPQAVRHTVLFEESARVLGRG